MRVFHKIGLKRGVFQKPISTEITKNRDRCCMAFVFSSNEEEYSE